MQVNELNQIYIHFTHNHHVTLKCRVNYVLELMFQMRIEQQEQYLSFEEAMLDLKSLPYEHRNNFGNFCLLVSFVMFMFCLTQQSDQIFL